MCGRGAERVSVSCRGELRGEKKIPGALRLLVGGQHAGALHGGESGWIAEVHGLRQTALTTHETAAAAVQVVLRSSWGHRLGARAALRQAEVQQAANTAMHTVDGLLRDLHQLRSRLLSGIRASDDASAARADALLERIWERDQ